MGSRSEDYNVKKERGERRGRSKKGGKRQERGRKREE